MEDTQKAIQYVELISDREDIESAIRSILTNKNGESINLKQLNIRPALLVQLQKILLNAGVIVGQANGNIIVESERAKSFLQIVDIVKLSRDYPWLPKERQPQLFASPPEIIPRALAANIDDIRNLLISLVSGARRSLTILSPYTTPAALRDILQPLQTSGQAETIKVDIYIANSVDDARRQVKALRALLRENPINNLRFYYKTGDLHEDSILHAKLLIADNAKGYLGSANFTGQGLTKHFELGIQMNSKQAMLTTEMLNQLVTLKIFQPLL